MSADLSDVSRIDADQHVDGGAGFDTLTLAFTDQTLDLSALGQMGFDFTILEALEPTVARRTVAPSDAPSPHRAHRTHRTVAPSHLRTEIA